MIQIDSTLKTLPEFLSKSTHDSKNFPEFWFISTHDSKNYLEYWLESTHVSMILFNFIPSTYLCFWLWTFLGCQLKCWLGMTFRGEGIHASVNLLWPLFGFRLKPFQNNWFESAHDSSSISETWIDSTAGSGSFPWIDSGSTHESSRFPTYWFRSTHGSSGFHGNQIKPTHDSKCFPLLDPNRLMTRAKNIWLWVDSRFNSDSYQCLLSGQT